MEKIRLFVWYNLYMKKIKVVELFAGVGGLDLGFKKAGFEIIFANDICPDAVKTYKQNIGDHIYKGDITKMKKMNFPKKFEVLLTSFPCQGFSIC